MCDLHATMDQGVGLFAGGVVAGAATKQTAKLVVPIAAGAALLGFAGHKLGILTIDRKKAEELRDQTMENMGTDGRLDMNDVREWLKTRGLPVVAASGAAVAGFVFGFKYF